MSNLSEKGHFAPQRAGGVRCYGFDRLRPPGAAQVRVSAFPTPQGLAAVTAHAFQGATPTKENAFKLPLAICALAFVIAQAADRKGA